MRTIVGTAVAVVMLGGIIAANYFTEFSLPLMYAGVGVVLGLVAAIDANRRDVERRFPAFGVAPIGVFALVAYGWPLAFPFFFYMTRPEAAPPPPRPPRLSTPVRPSAELRQAIDGEENRDPDAPPPPPRIQRVRPFPYIPVSTATVFVGLFAMGVPMTAMSYSIYSTFKEISEGSVAVVDAARAECLSVVEISRASFGSLWVDVHRAVGVTPDMYEAASEGIARSAYASHPYRNQFGEVTIRFLTYRGEQSMRPDSVAAAYEFGAAELAEQYEMTDADLRDDAHARQFMSLAIAGDSTARLMLVPEVQKSDTLLGSAPFLSRFEAGRPDSLTRMSCGSFLEPYGARRHRYVMHYPDARIETFDVQIVDADTMLTLIGYRHARHDKAALEIR